MSGRRYRVVKRLPWIEGGRPVLNEGRLEWEGGEDVVYEPGDTVYIDDREMSELSTSLCRKLEGLDDAGRAALEEVRAKAEGPAKRTLTADLDQADEVLIRALEALEEQRRAVRQEGQIETNYAILRDGTEVPLWTQVYPANPQPGVVYDDNGIPDPWATDIQRRRWEMESEIARIRSGAKRGARQSRETRQDKIARPNEALLAAVRAYRKKHPTHGRPAIAEALVDKFGGTLDHADPRGRQKAIEALRKRIERLEKEKSLDR